MGLEVAGEGLLQGAGGDVKLHQAVDEHIDRLFGRTEDCPPHGSMASVVVGFEGGDDTRLREGRLAAAARPGDEEQDALLAGGGELSDGLFDLLLAACVDVAMFIGE